MNNLFQRNAENSVIEEITYHPAWMGRVSGLVADKLLRDKKTPYLFVLREGELEGNYYVSFLLPDLTVKHQPFSLEITEAGWCYENTGPGGPYTHATIDDVLHLIMHCHKDDCTAYMNFQ